MTHGKAAAGVSRALTSRKQRRTRLDELQISSALMPPQLVLRNGTLDPGAEAIAAATARSLVKVVLKGL